ncbi:hypothetical protein [Marinobacter sp. CHS3-4]|uniref:hypothetical protein n=1 Tax=Marinobacter sp. CHS3-4 TaxID=3045174 RepID=UPI0024B62E00|nr:hypothetical protein [Marinobacter sp. CHS3-4]MDI9246811.1 hypothetical protein [Marinobacter sp. CHS3-4]
MKTLVLVVFAAFALIGCKDRVIWNDNGKVESATEGREIWDSKGKIDTGERKIWNDKEGDAVVK